MASLRVLLVDDDESIRHLLRAALPLSDFEVEVVAEARNGDEAIVAARHTHPDLIVLDHVMPCRSGGSVVPELRAVSPSSQILFFSAYLDAPGVGDSLRTIADRYGIEAISKSEFEQVDEAVSKLARQRGADPRKN